MNVFLRTMTIAVLAIGMIQVAKAQRNGAMRSQAVDHFAQRVNFGVRYGISKIRYSFSEPDQLPYSSPRSYSPQGPRARYVKRSSRSSHRRSRYAFRDTNSR